jgi:creatinine amidohydrolase
MLMHFAPNLVSPLSEAGDGKAKKFKVAGLREGWAWAPREWTRVTEDTGVGNPAKATAEKGGRFLEAATEKIGGFLVELAAADLGSMYE